MKNRERYLEIGVFVLVLLVAGWFTVTSERARASVDIPQSPKLIAGQDLGAFYAVEPTETGVNRIYLSKDGRKWRSLPQTVPGRLTTLAVSPVDDDVVYAATDDGLYATTDAGESWASTSPRMPVTALAMSSDMADLAYVATAEPALYRVTDVGSAWQKIAAKGLKARAIEHLAVSPANEETLLAATDNGIFRSTTAGETWSRTEGAAGTVSTIEFSPDNSTVVYAGTPDSGLLRSKDGGATWEQANAGLNTEPGVSLAITAMAVDPMQATTLYVSTAYVFGHTNRHVSPAGIFVSTDGGNHWVPIRSFDQRAPVVTALFPVTTGSVRAVTDEGVTHYAIDTERAVEQLSGSDVQTHLKGAKALSAAAKPEHTDTLLAHLNNSDHQIGYYVSAALARIGTDRVVTALSERVTSGDELTQRRAIQVLGTIASPDAVPALTQVFQSNAALARQSANALAAIGTDAALEPLIVALGENDTTRREAAMAALEHVGASAVPALTDATESDNAVLRANAARTLGWIGSSQGVWSVRPLLDDDSPAVREAAAWSLGQMGDVRSLPRLDQFAVTSDVPAIRAAALQAVVRIQENPTLIEAEIGQPRGTLDVIPTIDITLPPQLLGFLLILLTGLGAWFVVRRQRRLET